MLGVVARTGRRSHPWAEILRFSGFAFLPLAHFVAPAVGVDTDEGARLVVVTGDGLGVPVLLLGVDLGRVGVGVDAELVLVDVRVAALPARPRVRVGPPADLRAR